MLSEVPGRPPDRGLDHLFGIPACPGRLGIGGALVKSGNWLKRVEYRRFTRSDVAADCWFFSRGASIDFAALLLGACFERMGPDICCTCGRLPPFFLNVNPMLSLILAVVHR